MRIGRASFALSLVVVVSACGADPSPARRASSEASATDERSGSPSIQTPEERRAHLGEYLLRDCDVSASELCGVGVSRLTRDELRASGHELGVALVDAIFHREERDGELALQLTRERAHAEGGDTALIAALSELTDAELVMTAAGNADPSWRTRVLARGLPSPCPQLAQTVPSMAIDAQRSALAGAEGSCALACPEGLEALRAAGDDDREAVIVRACGPRLFGLASADDARLFADDPTALLALRGLTHTYEATRVMRHGGTGAVLRELLQRIDDVLARTPIDAHVPAHVPVAGGHLQLPVARAEDHGRGSLVVVLGPDAVHLGARPWIGLDAEGALARRGDPIPGPRLASTTDPAVLAQALREAIARAWRAPESTSGEPAEEARWLDEDGNEVAPAPPAATAVEVDVVADASAPIGRLVPLLAALEAARFHDPRRPDETLRPLLYLCVTSPDGPARVRLIPRLEGAPAPPRDLVVTATDARERPRPRRRAASPGVDLVGADVGVSGPATLPLARALEAIGDLGGEPVIELAVGPSAR